MSRPILSAVFLGLVGLLARPAAAPACSCVGRSAAAYIKQADLVFFGRAGTISTRGELSVQPFTVLHVIKGKPGPVFERVRTAGVMPPCNIEYAPDSLAVLFVTKGNVDLCAGNYVLEAQLPELGEYLAYREDISAAKAQPPPETAAFATALSASLGRYLHDRPVVQARFAPLAGTTIPVGKTELRFAAGAAGNKDLQITRAVVAGPLRLISGKYGAEGYSFDVILQQKDSAFTVLQSFGRER